MTLKELVELTNVNVNNNLTIIVKDENGRRINARNMSNKPLKDFANCEVERIELFTKSETRMDGSLIVEPALKVFVLNA